MNLAQIVLTGALIALPLASVQGASTQPATTAVAVDPSLPPSVSQALSAGNMAALQKALQKELTKRTGNSPAKMLKDASYQQLLAMHEILRVSGADNATEMWKKSPQNADFLKMFLQDREWMELYLGAGLIAEDSSAGLQVLSDIWKAEGQKKNFRKYISLATGISSFFTAGPFVKTLERRKEQCQPVRRFKIFKKLNEKGRLHPRFLKLRPWEIRFATGLHWDDKSYEWSNENVNLPWRRYTDAFVAVPYRGLSYFGDSIQGPLYYIPWRDLNSQTENSEIIGAVCGGGSHFGAIAAQAHGLPAYTVGQPSHCAYAVRVKRGDWRGGYGGPDGGMHNYIFGPQAPTSFLLMEAVFEDNNVIDKAYRWASQARLDEAVGNADAALKDWQEAVKVSPLHPFFRKELHRLMESKGCSPEDWAAYAKDALGYYTGHGFAAVDMLKDIQGKFLPSMSPADRVAWFQAVHRKLATSRTSWALKLEPILNDEMNYLKSEDEKADFLEKVLAVHLRQGDGVNFGQTLEWAVNTYVAKGDPDVFSKAFDRVARMAPAATSDKASDKAPDAKKLQEAYGKAIFATESARSMPAFQALSKAAASFSSIDTSKSTIKTQIPDGWKLMPPDGLVRCSSTSQWDTPQDHLNILRPCGGAQHTDKEANPSVIVELPKAIDLAGVLVTKRDGNEDRMKKMQVSTSVDGATWFPLDQTDDMAKEWLIKSPDARKAKWIKVEAQNPEPNFMHVRHILIYQK